MSNEELKRFVDFLKSLLRSIKRDERNKWFFDLFKEEIVKEFFPEEQARNTTDKFKSISEADVIRIKAYLNFVDKRALNFGKIFYKDIADKDLKISLINDFKEMKIALKNDDVIEFGRRMAMQLENIYNYTINKINAHQIIMEDREKYSNYIIMKKDGGKSYYNIFGGFFKTTKDNHEKIDSSNIPFYLKSIFLTNHFRYEVNVSNQWDILFLRNNGSHRSTLNAEDKTKLENIISNFDKKYTYYHYLLYNVLNGIPALRAD